MSELPAENAKKKPALTIRLVRDEEISAVADLTVSAYVGAYELESEHDYIAELGRVDERAKTQQVWVAVDTESGLLLGTVTTPRPGKQLSSFAQSTDLDFRMLAVSGEARGRGVGKALVAHCESLARDRGASRLVLHTGEGMDLAIALYERLGFERLLDVERNFPYPPGVWYPVRVYSKTL